MVIMKMYWESAAFPNVRAVETLPSPERGRHMLLENGYHEILVGVF
jgi:hypothetical protein